MVSVKEIRNKIKGIKNIQKITNAMEKVAASKMKKTQQRMLDSRPYIANMKQVIQHILLSNVEYKHDFFKVKDISLPNAYIVVSSDRGLCGSLNMNLFRTIFNNENKDKINVYNNSGSVKKFYISAIGRKACIFFSRFKFIELVALKYSIEKNFIAEDFLHSTKSIINLFLNNKVSNVFIIYNKFISSMLQKPYLLRILPFSLTTFDAIDDGIIKRKNCDYLYEPDSSVLFDLLFSRYIESITYQAVIENIACEQAARMIAMRNATSNASDVIRKFILTYNKVRQATITRELSEIVAGADAV